MDSSVLIIDSDPQVRKLLSIPLKTYGYEIVGAESDNEAQFFLQNINPSLLLLNLKMSRGYDRLSVVNLKEKLAVPIIVISGKEDEESINEAIANGADDFLLKPFKANEVISRVRFALDLLNQNPFEENTQSKHDVALDFLSFARRQGTEFTEKESMLLSLLTHFEGKLFTQQALLEKVIGLSTENGPQLLLTLISQLRKKIETDPNKPAHIISEPGIGYRFIGKDLTTERS